MNVGDQINRLIFDQPYRLSDGIFICECGNIRIYNKTRVVEGRIKSCGCYSKEAAAERLRKAVTKHGYGFLNNPTYSSWRAMRERCLYKKNKRYNKYGGAGIEIDPEWSDFNKFLSDMGERPSGKTLDRIDPNGGYFKENCQWADTTQQCFNQRKRKDNKSGKAGVKKEGNKWRAEIKKNKILYNLGLFAEFELAVQARESAEIELYGRLKGW